MGVTQKKQRYHAFALAIALVPVIATAQPFMPMAPGPPVDPNTRFEVAAIKAAGGGSGPVMMRMLPGGRLDINGLPIGILLRQALQKPDYQIASAPGWIDTERYSISAKAPEGTPPGAMTVMMANLLKDRFRLTTHLENIE
jgi:uncharacterized protein (TIGR03435 family)